MKRMLRKEHTKSRPKSGQAACQRHHRARHGGFGGFCATAVRSSPLQMYDVTMLAQQWVCTALLRIDFAKEG